MATVPRLANPYICFLPITPLPHTPVTLSHTHTSHTLPHKTHTYLSHSHIPHILMLFLCCCLKQDWWLTTSAFISSFFTKVEQLGSHFLKTSTKRVLTDYFNRLHKLNNEFINQFVSHCVLQEHKYLIDQIFQKGEEDESISLLWA